MDFSNTVFKRKFALNMYKDKKLLLGKMSFAKDFVNDTRGNPYPLLRKDDGCTEQISNGLYGAANGITERMFCQLFPYATYEVTAENLSGTVGFGFHLPTGSAYITRKDKQLHFTVGEYAETVSLPASLSELHTFLVSCRPGAFDVFFKTAVDSTVFFHSFSCPLFKNANQYDLFSNGYASLIVGNGAAVSNVSAYIDCGISQADIRPIRYENGDIMLESGKLYLTASIRMQAEMFQGVFSWVPGTAEFELTGALFYDVGDGKWCGDVAASVLYHREQKQFLLWVCSFSHGHILGHAAFEGDPRFGVNVVDITLMPKAAENTPVTAFLGFEGDEDPDFFYSAEEHKWYMAICRLDPAVRGYRYFFFKSDDPFSGYTCIGQGFDGAETGGSFVKIKNERCFVCGNDFNTRSDYRIYTKDGMQHTAFNFPDGGFRGWGTWIPVKIGSRTRYFWLTFDRHNGSDYNWSYGNVYCFETEL